MQDENLKQLQEIKLERLYKEVLAELKSIEIDMQNEEKVGKIDIKISKRASKRYGCCKQEEPDKNYKIVQKTRKYTTIKYEKFKKHHIEISRWVLNLNDEIIKNTITHELIHCIPYCNNHGTEFKKYANYINQKLGYNITRVGNKKDDYEASGIEYKEENSGSYKYKIICKKCGQEIYRKRFNKNLIKKYRCGKCGGKLELY